MPGKPGQSYAINGERHTGKFRVRPRFLFGDVCEELIEKSDGSAFWRRVEYPKGLRIVHTDKREGE